MRWWLVAVVLAGLLALYLRRARRARPPTPALKLAGGPPDEAEDASAGRPLFDAIRAALRDAGAEVAPAEADDWGYVATATVAGQALTLRLGAHGQNGVGRIWLLVLDGAGVDAAQTVERAVAAIAGVRVLGWDD